MTKTSLEIGGLENKGRRKSTQPKMILKERSTELIMPLTKEELEIVSDHMKTQSSRHDNDGSL